jgi:hypothetical protein
MFSYDETEIDKIKNEIAKDDEEVKNIMENIRTMKPTEKEMKEPIKLVVDDDTDIRNYLSQLKLDDEKVKNIMKNIQIIKPKEKDTAIQERSKKKDTNLKQMPEINKIDSKQKYNVTIEEDKPKINLVIENKNTEKTKKILKFLEEKREVFYYEMFKMISSPSRRTMQNMNKILDLDKQSYELLEDIYEGKNKNDFIPTPNTYIEPLKMKIKDKNYNKLLEPCCGLGNVIHEVLKVRPDMIIKAYEINYKFINILKKLFPLELYPNITFLSKNFLTANEKESFPIIFCNPPFTKGGDSYYYINFFFECCKISKQSNTGIENLIYFISPPLINTKIEKNQNIDPYSALHSKFLNKKRIDEILNKNIDTKEYNKYKKNDDDNIIDEIMEDKYAPNQISILDNVKFKGTNFPAYLYEILIINEQIGKGKRHLITKKILGTNEFNIKSTNQE